MQAQCGATRSRSGKEFTGQSLAQHERDCPVCNPGGFRHTKVYVDEAINLELTMMIGDDLSDGAFWALAHELGEL